VLIGRSRELQDLVPAIAEGRAIALLGEAGVGKTSLVREAASRSKRRLSEGGALATLSWMPYLPIQRALRRPVPSGDEVYVAGEVDRAIGASVLFLDDLQWADGHTRRLLPLLVDRMSIVAAIRRGDPGAPAALEQVAALGFEVVHLEPLAQDPAAELVARVRPDLSGEEIIRIVRRSGGNPLLLEELAAHGGPSDSLKLALAARLQLLSASAVQAMGLLALAGRPVDPAVVPAGLGELLAAGLAIEVDGEIGVRHALIAESAVERLPVDRRRALHSLLATRVGPPGERARHHLAAGDRHAAFDAALEAAAASEYPGERASHLALAAGCAEGGAADELRLRAAVALVEANDYAEVEALLGQVSGTDALVRAERELLRYQARDVALDLEGARAAWRAAMSATAGSGSDLEVRLRIEEARVAYLIDLDPRAVEIAEAGLRLARTRRRHETLALFILGSARSLFRRRGWERPLRAALDAAQREGEISVEQRAANNLIFGLMVSGRLVAARAVAVRMTARARDRRLGRWEQRFEAMRIGIEWSLGYPRDAVAAGRALLDEILEENDRSVATSYLAQALIDAGEAREAMRWVQVQLAAFEASTGASLTGAEAELGVDALWGLSEAEFWAGRPRQALAAADDCFGRFSGVQPIEGESARLSVTRGWAQFELGVSVDGRLLAPDEPPIAGEVVELRAIGLLATGRPAEASESFLEAAALWRPRDFRSHLRCLWASGEAQRRVGDTTEAIRQLERAERIARERGYEPLLGRIRRSLRLAGVPRMARRRVEGRVTARERELLGLVSEGLSNHEIARRLGLSRSTVKRHIETAADKLGAVSRLQAAALAARE